MKTYNVALVSLGGSLIPFGNVLNDSRKYGNLNLEILDAYLKKQNHKSTLLYFFHKDFDDNIVEKLKDYNFFVFFIDYYNFNFAMRLISLLKKRQDCLIVCFGKSLEAKHKEVIMEYNAIDYVCLGNPNRIISKILNGECVLHEPNVVSATSFQNKTPDYSFDKDIIPTFVYYKEGVGTENKYKTYILATRNNTCCGCCTFCLSEKRKYVYKDIDVVIAEIKFAVASGIRDFLIVDNDFFEFCELNRLEKLLNELSKFKEKITFSCFAKSKTIVKIDQSLLLCFKNAGFYCVFLGIDAGNNADKKLYKKGSNLAEDFEAYYKLKNVGIFTRIGFIFTNPYSTLETFRENYNTLVKLNTSNIYHFGHLKLMLFPGTAIHKKLEEDGLSLIKNLNSYNPYLYNYKNQYVNEIVLYIDNLIEKLEGTKEFYPFIYFERLFREAEFLNKNRLSEYELEFQKLRCEEVDCLNAFFKIVFVDNKLDLAKEKEKAFINSILARSVRTKELASKIEKIIYEEKHYGN